jgi:hypothetical protein
MYLAYERSDTPQTGIYVLLYYSSPVQLHGCKEKLLHNPVLNS